MTRRFVNIGSKNDRSGLVSCDQAVNPDHFVDVDELVSAPFGTNAVFVRAGMALSVQCDKNNVPELITLALGRHGKNVGLFTPMTPATARQLVEGLFTCIDMVEAAARDAAAAALARAKGGAK